MSKSVRIEDADALLQECVVVDANRNNNNDEKDANNNAGENDNKGKGGFLSSFQRTKKSPPAQAPKATPVAEVPEETTESDLITLEDAENLNEGEGPEEMVTYGTAMHQEEDPPDGEAAPEGEGEEGGDDEKDRKLIKKYALSGLAINAVLGLVILGLPGILMGVFALKKEKKGDELKKVATFAWAAMGLVLLSIALLALFICILFMIL